MKTYTKPEIKKVELLQNASIALDGPFTGMAEEAISQFDWYDFTSVVA